LPQRGRELFLFYNFFFMTRPFSKKTSGVFVRSASSLARLAARLKATPTFARSSSRIIFFCVFIAPVMISSVWSGRFAAGAGGKEADSQQSTADGGQKQRRAASHKSMVYICRGRSPNGLIGPIGDRALQNDDIKNLLCVEFLDTGRCAAVTDDRCCRRPPATGFRLSRCAARN
jgi:hypothetical protein